MCWPTGPSRATFRVAWFLTWPPGNGRYLMPTSRHLGRVTASTGCHPDTELLPLELHMTAIASTAGRDATPSSPPETPLRIAMVAPPFYPIPPSGYGGIEAVVAQLADGLVERGHEVTLIAARGSRTKAHLLTTFDEPQWERLGRAEPELLHAARVSEHLADLRPEVVHDHSAAGPAFVRDRSVPTVVTSHGPATGDWGEYLEAGGDSMYLVAISQAQVDLTPQLPWRAVVHNSLDTREIPFQAEKEDYLVWLGRMSPDKAAHLAIDVARKAGRRIVLVGKCSEPDEQAYFETEVQPRLGPDVDYHGEIELDHKYELLGGAAAFLFPLQWEEPFGMVLIEAMACGTPVLSLARGAVPEVVVDGVTGFVRREPDELVDALHSLDQIDPRACRHHVEGSFSPDHMVSGYEQVYRDCLRGAASTFPAAARET
jgi:glycosyltransferase involved in cell wall biosynthesis